MTFTPPQIKVTDEKKLVGMRLKMSLANNKTQQLWKSFMPRHKEIKNRISNGFISMQVYHGALNDFEQEFEKWAVVEVSSFENIPSEMEIFTLESGLYAVFNYVGLPSDTRIYQYIFGEWIPNSGYTVDHRLHFEILGEKYKNGDSNSEEEIWIPVKQ